MVSTVSLDRQPLVWLVLSRTVAKVDSMGLLVRMCFQSLAGLGQQLQCSLFQQPGHRIINSCWLLELD